MNEECPYCHRIMSIREKEEQGACNDCYEARRAEPFIPEEKDGWP